MNVNSTLGNVRRRLKKQAAKQHDELVDVKTIQFKSVEEIQIGDRSMKLRPSAQHGIAYLMKVPLPFLRMLPPELSATNLNHIMKTQEKHSEWFFRFSNDSVRAVMSQRYHPVNHLEVVETIVDLLQLKNNAMVQVALDENLMSLNIPDTDRGFSINGDDHHPGISICNSEVGVSALHISALVWRLVCSNGLITSAGVGRKSFRHVSKNVMANLPDHLEKIVASADSQSNQLAVSQNTHVSDPEATFAELFKRFIVGRQEQESVNWGFANEPGSEMFSIIQAFTKGSQHPNLSAESSTKLQVIGGRILNMVEQ